VLKSLVVRVDERYSCKGLVSFRLLSHLETDSIRSPFLMMVSGRAILPFTVVTPDSRAYL
jgi:hypothetical protein